MLMYDPRFSAIERLVTRRANAKSKNFTSSSARPLSASFHSSSSGSGGGSGKGMGLPVGGPNILTPGQMLKGAGPGASSGLSNPNPPPPSSVSSSGASGAASASAKPMTSFMWGMWQCGDEITFLLEEDDVAQFPPGALQIVPQQWRVIKLSGRAIDFDETGVVSAMSQVDTGIPALNISTALTNCTLVPDELLSVTLDSLASTMNLPIEKDGSKH